MSTQKNAVATPAEESPATPPAREQIAARAYAIAEQQGFPCGCELAHWLQAETELSSGEGHACCASAEPATDAPAT